MAQEWGGVERYSARRRVRDGLEKGGKIREGEAHGERGRCDTQRGNEDGDQVGVGHTMTGITCFTFLSMKAVKMSLVSKCDHFL